MSKGLGFSPADLQSGLKKLETVEDSGAKTAENKTNQGEDKQTIAEIQTLKDVYNELDGNIEEIFRRLQGGNPRKALKYRPKDADEFAQKFYHGFYTVLEEDSVDPTVTSADSKDSHK